MNKDILVLLGYTQGISSFFVVMVTFFRAYFLNNMRWCVKINAYGEAHVELLFILLFQLPFITIGFYYLIKNFKNKNNIRLY